MNDRPRVVVLGASDPTDLPLADALQERAALACAAEAEELKRVLPGAAVMLGWDFRADELQHAWDAAGDLEWIHWCGAGVDAALFPALRESDVVLTNARGAFDRAMAEYVLGLVIALARGFPGTLAAAAERRWAYRMTETVLDKRALVVGVGSIGRSIARLLNSAGMEVSGVGRTSRSDDPDFVRVRAIDELDPALADADVVINVTPLTDETRDLFTAARFSEMKPSAYFVNVGRGASVDEGALAAALRAGTIRGAALDVFRVEPLPVDSPLWAVDNLIVSPHMSGDTPDYQEIVMRLFIDNLDRYLSGRPLLNVVDKAAGFIPS